MKKWLLVVASLVLPLIWAEDWLEPALELEEMAGEAVIIDSLPADPAAELIEPEQAADETSPQAQPAALPETVSSPLATSPAEPPSSPPLSGSADPTSQAVNVVNVSEAFYLLTYNEATASYSREPTGKAKPGDLVEIVVTAVNASTQRVSDIELVNSVPQAPAQLVADSLSTNLQRSLYRVSRNGQSFFPADAEIDPASIGFIQWLIFSLAPGEQLQLSYRMVIR